MKAIWQIIIQALIIYALWVDLITMDAAVISTILNAILAKDTNQ